MGFLLGGLDRIVIEVGLGFSLWGLWWWGGREGGRVVGEWVSGREGGDMGLVFVAMGCVKGRCVVLRNYETAARSVAWRSVSDGGGSVRGIGGGRLHEEI
jgi:hypothetical protein